MSNITTHLIVVAEFDPATMMPVPKFAGKELRLSFQQVSNVDADQIIKRQHWAFEHLSYNGVTFSAPNNEEYRRITQQNSSIMGYHEHVKDQVMLSNTTSMLWCKKAKDGLNTEWILITCFM